MIGISTPRNGIVCAALDRIALNRNVHTNSAPLCTYIRARPSRSGCLSASKVISIFRRSTGYPVTNIDSSIRGCFENRIFRITVCTRVRALRSEFEGSRFTHSYCACATRHTYQHACRHKQSHKLFHKMYLLRFFFRSFSLCYLLSCGILLTILAKHTAFQWRVPPLALFAGIIFHIHVSRSPLEPHPSSA